MIYDHMTSWQQLPVNLYDEERSNSPVTAGQVANVCFRLAVDGYGSDLTFAELFERFVSNPAVAETEALVIGAWGDTQEGSEEVVRLLAGAHKSLPKLKSLFLGDIIGEECELSWIVQSDLGPLFTAWPGLEHFGVRGSGGLDFGGPLRMASLQTLIVETGGMPLNIFRQATEGDLPALQHLELWLGTENYGGEVRAAHLTELLSGKKFPALVHLGLRNSDVQDGVAIAVAKSPLLERIKSLDLSMGTLGDDGGQALLDSPEARRLEALDLHYHYMSDEMVEKLQAAFPFANLDRGDAEEDADPDDRYVAVGE